MVNFTPKMVKNIFGITVILTASKIIPVTLQAASLTAPSYQQYYLMYFQIFQLIVDLKKKLKILFLNIVQIQTDKYKILFNFA